MPLDDLLHAARLPRHDSAKSAGWAKTSTERTPYRAVMAQFDLTPTMRLAADAPGRTAVQNARMFALYQMAFDDAVLAMADAKAHYDFWRPITAIRNGADDGNDATAPDAGRTPLPGTPNFAEYPCGHCVVAAAEAEVMKAEVGPRSATGVRVGALAAPMSAVQVLPGRDERVQDVSDSRIHGGVHFRRTRPASRSAARPRGS